MRTRSGERADQHRERVAVLRQGLLERRDRGAQGVDQALLLRDVERGGGAGIEPLLDQVEHAGGAVQVLARDAQPVLRGQHLEIGIGGGDHGGQPTTSRS